MKLLITGAGGLLGSKLAKTALAANHEVYSLDYQHSPKYGIPILVDISDEKSVYEVFEETKPDVAIHAAALTDVDLCETNKQLAQKINSTGTANIANACKQQGIFLIYISTDYIFDGKKGFYQETDNPAPIDYYGITKLEGEEHVKKTLEKYCIGRTSVVYGSTPAAGKTNFALWLVDKLKDNQNVRIVTDQWNSPTLNTNLADMTLEIAEKQLTGTYHLAGATRTNRFDFSKQIAKTFGLNSDLINPALSEEFKWPAKRPKDSSLNTAKAQNTLQNKPLEIDQALRKMKHEIETQNR
jgi:dTDP-4-dehydrorhamnose reductase